MCRDTETIRLDQTPVQCCGQHQVPQKKWHKHPSGSWYYATLTSHQTWLKSPSLKAYILLKLLTF